CGDTGPLRLDATSRLRVVGGAGEIALAFTDLQRECALPRLGDDLVRLEAVTDLGREAEPIEAAGRQHDRVEPALAALAQPGVDVPAQGLDRESRLEREQLRLAAHGGGADAHPRTDLLPAAERITRIV